MNSFIDLTSTVPSTNFQGRGDIGPRLIIVHSTRSAQPYTPEQERIATVNFIQNPNSQRSYHIVQQIDTGDFYFLVPWAMSAYHAGYLNPRSIGWALTQGLPSQNFPYSTYPRLAEGLGWLCDNFQIPRLHVLDENLSGIIGHYETAQGRASGKTDPQPLDWGKLMSLLVPVIDERQVLADSIKEQISRLAVS